MLIFFYNNNNYERSLVDRVFSRRSYNIPRYSFLALLAVPCVRVQFDAVCSDCYDVSDAHASKIIIIIITGLQCLYSPVSDGSLVLFFIFSL